jgi:hypothetical protein
MSRATLIVAVLLLASAAGCIVPEDMPALREDLGYASVDRPDLVVKARASTQTPTVEEPVQLSAETEGVDLSAVELTWDVNGTTHEGPTTEVAFPTAGSYPVELAAEGPNGTRATDRITIEAQPNQPPSPDLRIEGDALWADSPVVLRADGSTDPDGDELTYEWRIDDEPVEAEAVLETQLGPGPHSVQLSVSDGHATETVERDFAVDDRVRHQANLTLIDDSAEFTLPVAASLDQAELRLTHSTQEGVDQVNLTVQAADGSPVASVVTDPGPGASEASAQLALEGEALAAEPHTLVLRLEQGSEAMATIEGVFTYSPLPSGPG